MFVRCCAAGTTGYAVTGNTHNAPPFLKTSYALRNVQWPLTWPGCRSDQKGTAPSVEQGHCTLIAVKRYRDPPRIGGRHNFLLRPCLSMVTTSKIKTKLQNNQCRPRGAPACFVSNDAYPWQKFARCETKAKHPTPQQPCSAEVSSDRTNLSPFTKDYRGLALQCD